jgi:hypothetical protein
LRRACTTENISQKFGELITSENITSYLGQPVLGASYDGRWTMDLPGQTLRSKKLVVAHSVWETQDWLPMELLPKPLLALNYRTQASSAVVLSVRLPAKSEITPPERGMIPAEEVYFFRQADLLTYAFVIYIDFETSLDAPSVGKAVKKLKRALHKWLHFLKSDDGDAPSLEDHLHLIPYAWTQSPRAVDSKYIRALSNHACFQQNHLFFCGDTYGDSYDPDKNTLESVESAMALIKGDA